MGYRWYYVDNLRDFCNCYIEICLRVDPFASQGFSSNARKLFTDIHYIF